MISAVVSKAAKDVALQDVEAAQTPGTTTETSFYCASIGWRSANFEGARPGGSDVAT